MRDITWLELLAYLDETYCDKVQPRTGMHGQFLKREHMPRTFSLQLLKAGDRYPAEDPRNIRAHLDDPVPSEMLRREDTVQNDGQ